MGGTTTSKPPAYVARIVGPDVRAVGTCFQVDPAGVLVTAWHVLDGLGAGHEGAVVQVEAFGEATPPTDATVLRVDARNDIAVLRRSKPLAGTARRMVPTDSVTPGTDLLFVGPGLLDDPHHVYAWLPGRGRWKGSLVRDDRVIVGSLASSDVLPGMSGTPVRRLSDDAVLGMITGRYNSGDGWYRDAAWVCRVEDLAVLLRGLATVTVVESVPAMPFQATIREIRRRSPDELNRSGELRSITEPAGHLPHYTMVAGPAYAGKTSLLAEAALGIHAAGADVICYFPSRVERKADSADFLEQLVGQLSRLMGEPRPAADRYAFHELWQRAADRAETQNRDLWLVVDGLDEDFRPAELPSIASLLPTAVGTRTRVLVSMRADVPPPADLPERHPLNSALRIELLPYEGAGAVLALARKEIEDLLRRDGDGLTAEILGILTAAEGALSLSDLAAIAESDFRSTKLRLKIRQTLLTSAARSVTPTTQEGTPHFRFAHDLMLAYAREHALLADAVFRQRIHDWADRWRDRGWPSGGAEATPAYLFEVYPQLLTTDPARLTALVMDISWLETSIRTIGPDRTLAHLSRAEGAAHGDPSVSGIRAAVAAQIDVLRASASTADQGFVLRQLCLCALELGDSRLSAALRDRLAERAPGGPIPLWSTRRASRAVSAELGRHPGLRVIQRVPGKDLLVTSGLDGRVLCWDLRDSARPPHDWGREDGRILTLAAFPDGRVAAAGADRRITIRTGNPGESRSFGEDVHEDWVRAIAVLDAETLVSANADVLHVWNVSGNPSVLRAGRTEGWVRSLCPCPDGRFASGTDTGQIVLWTATPAALIGSEIANLDCAVEVLVMNPDGRLLSGGADGRILAWHLAEDNRCEEVAAQKGWIQAIAVLDRERIACASSGDERLLIWRLSGRAEPVMLTVLDEPARSLAVLADGRVASGGDDDRVRIWDASAASMPANGIAAVRSTAVTAVAVTEEGAVLTGDTEGSINLIEAVVEGVSSRLLLPGRGGQPVNPLQPMTDAVTVLRSLPRKRMLSGGGGRIGLWKRLRRGLRQLSSGEDSTASRFNDLLALPDGHIVSASTGNLIYIYEPDDKFFWREECLGAAEGYCAVGALALTCHGLVASGDEAGYIRLWDPEKRAQPRWRGGIVTGTGPYYAVQEPIEVGRHPAAVTSLVSLPGPLIVSGGQDGRLLAWADDAGAGLEVGAHDGPVRGLRAVSARLVVSCGADARVRFWDVRQPRLVSEIATPVTTVDVSGVTGGGAVLAIAHEPKGVSRWFIKGDADER